MQPLRLVSALARASGAVSRLDSLGRTKATRGWRRRRSSNRTPSLQLLEERWTPAATITVDTLADTHSFGHKTLREAITEANGAHDPRTIKFSVSGTIVLTQGQLEITNGANFLSIEGPGADQLAISGNNSSRIFMLDEGVTANISGLTITGGKTPGTTGIDGFGGGILDTGELTLSNCVITGNTAAVSGGGISTYGFDLTLDHCMVNNNSASQSGGGIYAGPAGIGGSLTMSGSTISGNSAPLGGGMALITQNGTITGSTISENMLGGGIYLNRGQWTISDTAIADNTADVGGGINNGAAALTLLNSTISGNTAQSGGGIYAEAQSYALPLTMTNVTISNNQATSGAGSGGGLYVEAGGGSTPLTPAVTLGNTLVAGNSDSAGADDATGQLAAASSFNLIGAGTLVSGITNGAQGNQIGSTASPIDAMLAVLGNYGGPTQSMALLPGSPALDAGSNVLATSPGRTTDQRGAARIFNSTVDIGAVEMQGYQLIGTNTVQTAALNNQFELPLAVTLLENGASPFNQPLPGATVVYTAGSSAGGATASLSTAAPTDASGQTSVTATANNTEGFYTVTAQVGNLAGNQATATFALTNAPTFLVNDIFLVIEGTFGDDQLSITGGDTTFTVVLNGQSQSFDSTKIINVLFHGNGGSDTTTMLSASGPVNASFAPRHMNVSMGRVSFSIDDSQTNNVFGSFVGSNATFADSTGDDLFFGQESYCIMQNAPGNPLTYYNEAVGFFLNTVNASSGTDNAYLYNFASSMFYAVDNTTRLFGSDQFSTTGFDNVFAFLSDGGQGFANLSPSSAMNTYVFGDPTMTANLFDSSGNDLFFAVPGAGYSFMQGTGFVNEVVGIGVTKATSTNGGADEAIFYDTSGNDTFDSTDDSSKLTSSDSFTNSAVTFGLNYVFFSSGNDTANLNAGTARANYVYGNAADTANFTDSSGNDVFYGLPSYGYMSYNGGSYVSQAIGFGHLNATSSPGGSDQAYVYDSPGDDSLVIGGSTATLNLASPKIVIQVNHFPSVFATRNQGGNDTEAVGAHDFFFASLGGWKDVSPPH